MASQLQTIYKHAYGWLKLGKTIKYTHTHTQQIAIKVTSINTD